jgi:2-dehydropantoate 2-reductase
MTPYAVVGAGAIGGSLAALMANVGLDVVVIDASADHVAAINEGGLRLTGTDIDITARLRAVTPDRIDFPLHTVLLSVKSQDTGAALTAVIPHLADSGFVVSLQNGLNEYEIAERIGPHRVVGALVNWAADYLAPGAIQYGGASNFVIGELNGPVSDRVRNLVAAMPRLAHASASANVLGFLWSKQINITLLFTTGITPLTMSDCLQTPEFETLFATLAAEGIALADEYGVTLEELDDFRPQLYRSGAVAQALRVTADHYRPMLKQHSGLYRDLVIRKRTSEADGTLGSAIRRGAARGHAMPAHRAVLNMITQIERGHRDVAAGNLSEIIGSLEARP